MNCILTLPRWLALALDTNKGLMAQRYSTSVRTYATMRIPEDWAKTCGIPFETNPDEAKQKLLVYYEGWAPELRKLVEVCNDKLIPRRIYKLPIDVKWEHTPGVTVRSSNRLTGIPSDVLHCSCLATLPISCLPLLVKEQTWQCMTVLPWQSRYPTR